MLQNNFYNNFFFEEQAAFVRDDDRSFPLAEASSFRFSKFFDERYIHSYEEKCLLVNFEVTFFYEKLCQKN